MENETAIIVVALIAAISSISTIFITKYYDRRFDKLKIKEKHYVDFLSNITLYKAGYPEAKKALNESVQVIYLIGDNDVVSCTKDFMDYLESPGPSNKNLQDALYSCLIHAMRDDLYGKRKSKDFPNKLGLTTFQ